MAEKNLTPLEDDITPQEEDGMEEVNEEVPDSFEEEVGKKEDGKGRFSKKKGRMRSRRKEKEEKEFEEEVIDIARVTRVVKGGRRLRFRATVVIGDKKGRVGIGTGKSIEVATAIKKAVSDAKKSLIDVRTINGTIPHDKYVKYKSAEILIMPAPSGTGVIAGGSFRKVAMLAGITDIFAKMHGTNNPLVAAQASIKALSSFCSPRRKMKDEKGE